MPSITPTDNGQKQKNVGSVVRTGHSHTTVGLPFEFCLFVFSVKRLGRYRRLQKRQMQKKNDRRLFVVFFIRQTRNNNGNKYRFPLTTNTLSPTDQLEYGRAVCFVNFPTRLLLSERTSIIHTTNPSYATSEAADTTPLRLEDYSCSKGGQLATIKRCKDPEE